MTCDRCAKIGHTFPGAATTATSLGRVSTWKRDCPLCAVWLQLAGIGEFPERAYDEESNYHVLPFNTASLFDDPPAVRLISIKLPVSYAVVEEENSIDQISLWNCVRGRGWLSPVPSPISKAPPFSARVTTSQADFALFKRCLSNCIDTHQACASSFRREVIPIKLVDCCTYRVVSRSADEPYLTLSYVNSAVQEDLSRHRRSMPRLTRPLPELYEDAMLLTKKLGYNHLWIDNYCIPQKDDRNPPRYKLTEAERLERKGQVAQMDQIYTRSDLTIIAAHGMRGLPGITKRKPSVSVRLSGQDYMVSPPTPSYEIENCDANERSWCYQEATLCTRRLVMLKDHVYFKCRTTHVLESLHGDLLSGPRTTSSSQHSTADDMHRWNEFEIFANIAMQKSDPLDHIYNHIAEYTKRRLSRPEDILFAIAGVMAQLKSIYPSLFAITGVPIVPRSPTDKFSILDCTVTSLCWKTAFECSRRPSFPSWSWAGWYLPGQVIGASPTFQARGGSLPYLDAGERTLKAEEGLRISFDVDNTDVVDDRLRQKLRESTSELTYQPHLLVFDAKMVDVVFELWVPDTPGSSDGHATFLVKGSKAILNARIFPSKTVFPRLLVQPSAGLPSTKWPSNECTLIVMGAGRSTKGTAKLVMLVVKQNGNEGSWERIGIVDVEGDRIDRVRKSVHTRRLSIS